jgi:hypothetical protein
MKIFYFCKSKENYSPQKLHIMKRRNYALLFIGLILSSGIVFSGCKKKSSDEPTYPAVAFIVTYVTVPLQGGSDGVEFFANCSTTDVKMTKVQILDPIHSGTVTYNLNDQVYVKSQIFALQDDGTAYLKEGGTYQITFTGHRTVDNAAFTIVSNVNVAK